MFFRIYPYHLCISSRCALPTGLKLNRILGITRVFLWFLRFLEKFHAETTIQEAANFLNVFRSYLIELLESGKMPFRKIGRHRRVLFEDLVKYKEYSKEKNSKLREKLAEEAQDLDVSY